MDHVPVEDHELEDVDAEEFDFDDEYDDAAEEKDDGDEQMGGISSQDQLRPNQQVAPPPQDQRHVRQQQQRAQQQGRTGAGENPAEQEPVLDGYDRTDLIGQGAYGVVFRGTQRSSGDTVAIKRIPFGDNHMEGWQVCLFIAGKGAFFLFR